MPGLVVEKAAQFRDAPAAAVAAAAAGSAGIWSRRRDEITFDRLQKFWSELPLQARQELLRIDKQTLIEQARKNLYCSRCNGLLLESFTQIVLYGKSLQQEGSGMALPSTTGESRICKEGELDEVQDPLVHPWGGLATTKDGILTLLDCFLNSKSLKTLQNVFDNARAREREREMLYPDACGGGGRGWISQGMATYGRGHGIRETCALHTARLSCDTLVDFWSALGEETRSSLLRMKEEDFIERLMYRFDSKRFCRDCRRNVIREFKELKELKRMRREPRCTSWFCVADTAFQCEVSEDAVVVDWHQSFSETDGSYHHFEWAIGTDEGKSDVVDFEDVGMNGQAHRDGLDLGQYDDYFITLRAWRLDGRCTEFSVKAHALKGQSCVHRRLVVGDGFVTITKGDNIRSFFEHAEEAEEEDEDDAMDRDGNELDGDGSHPQKHAKSPELAREFLLDAATVIFKEQVEKAFREGTARQNAHSVFVSLALKLLEDRVHVACKVIITLEKQTKLLEEEEKEKREEEERRERRRTKEREKKLRRKERMKEKERKLVESKSSNDILPTSTSNSLTSANDDSPNTPYSRDSASEQEDNAEVAGPHSPDTTIEQSSTGNSNKQSLEDQCNNITEFTSRDCIESFISEQSKSSRRKLRLRKDSPQEQTSFSWYDDCPNESGSMADLHRPSRDRVIRNTTRNCNSQFSTNSRTRDRFDYHPCSCGHQEDYRIKDSYFTSPASSSREMKMARKTVAVAEKPRLQYRSVKYSNGCYPLESFIVSKGSHGGGGVPNKSAKQVWEPTDTRKKSILDNTNGALDAAANPSKQAECTKEVTGCQKLDKELESLAGEHSKRSEDVCKPKTHQLCKEDEKNQAGSDNETVLVTKSDCCLVNGGELEHDTGSMTNFASSDNCSSCLSEGDSSMSSSSARNPESSSTSDSEESSDRNNNSTSDSSARTSSGSLLENCSAIRFTEYQPKIVRPSNNDGYGVGMTPLHDPVLHHHSTHVPAYTSATMGFHNPSWAAVPNGYFPFAQPGHLPYSSPLGYGVARNQCADFSIPYNNVHPFPAPSFGVAPQPAHKTAASFSLVGPASLYGNGDSRGRQQHVSLGAEPLMGSRRPLGNLNPDRHLPPKSKPMIQNGGAENTAKPQDKTAPFSLFHFGLPIAPPAPPSCKDERCGTSTPKAPAATPAQTCSREETTVKEYNLFSAKSGGIFSFL